MLEKEEQKVSDDPSLSMAKLMELGWVLEEESRVKQKQPQRNTYTHMILNEIYECT